MDWKDQFEIIEIIAKKKFADEGKNYTLKALEDELGVSRGKSNHWKKGQRPSSEDLAKISVRLDITPEWLLLGTGEPTVGAEPGEFNPDFVPICDTLHDIVLGEYRDRFEEFALTGGITPTELSACISSQALPPATAIRRWIRKFRINANFLLAQIGNSHLTEREFSQPGPLSWAREKYDQEGDEQPVKPIRPSTPVTDALRETELAMRRVGASDQSVWAAVHGLARDRMGQASEPDTETAKRVGNDKNG